MNVGNKIVYKLTVFENFIFFCLFLACCKQSNLTIPANTNSKKTSKFYQQPSLYIAQKSSFDIKDLILLSASPFVLKKSIISVEWSMDERADFLSWQLCPKSSHKECQKDETSSLDTLFFPNIAFGTYTLAMRACVRAYQTTQGQNNLCGPPYLLDISQPKEDLGNQETVQTLIKKKRDLHDLSLRLSAVTKEFESGLQNCSIKEKDQNIKKMYEIMYIQSANLNALGPDFLEKILSDEKPLAAISIQTNPQSQTLPGQDQSQGFSLTQDITTSGDPNLTAGVKDFPKDLEIPSGFSVWKTTMTSLSSNMDQLPINKTKFGSQYLQGLFGIQGSPDYCYIFPKTLKSFQDIQDQAKEIKQDINKLKKDLTQ